MNTENTVPAQRHTILFIVSAPSGTGKTSLCSEVARTVPELCFSISHTTRPPRPGEKNGVEYYFVSPEEFRRYLAEHTMAEWTEIYGNCYGTSTETIQRVLDSGCDIIFDIDERGARQLVSAYPDSVTILILPPSLAELKKRLTERGTDDPSSISKRLKRAQQEIEAMSWYQYVVINDKFADAVSDLTAIIRAERCKRNHPIITSIVANDSQTAE
ncbi:MAG: guanylate kinase [Proteobacteria bacterium]|nr:guanylate kinase [Pseudomonadota bacterium]